MVDDDTLGIALDETTTRGRARRRCCDAFGVGHLDAATGGRTPAIPAALRRTGDFLTHPVFHEYHSETQMLRYLRRLADQDLALDRTMIPLGLVHHEAQRDDRDDADHLARVRRASTRSRRSTRPRATGSCSPTSSSWLCEITGYDAVSLQPNAGSQGELAGLLAIRAYHRDRGDEQPRRLPHPGVGARHQRGERGDGRHAGRGRRPRDDDGNVDLDDLKQKASEHADQLGALMVTYPSTHGVFEAGIGDVCAVVHEHGGQVYVDGANLNALVGLAAPGAFGADVSHLNLHKTFCIPHGGGGPGVGPIGVREHLAPYLPSHPVVPECGPQGGGIGAIAAAPWGSAGILPISWAYIAMMGPDGLRRATQVAILNANYVARTARAALPGALHRAQRPGRARVHRRPPADHRGDAVSPSTTSPSGSSTTASTRRR